MIQVKVKKMFDDVQLPEYATPGSACFDIRAYTDEYYVPHYSESTLVRAYSSESFGTGLQFEIPENHVLLVFSRSGHGFNKGVRLSNCTGVIDSDYRGELKVKLKNDSCADFSVSHGERIAQGMVIPYEQVSFVLSEELSSTERGEGGFGSTGV